MVEEGADRNRRGRASCMRPGRLGSSTHPSCSCNFWGRLWAVGTARPCGELRAFLQGGFRKNFGPRACLLNEGVNVNSYLLCT
jgi:hypothetical protein